jgi:5-(carboxyamino)imidazole ribonucleotide synthase
LNSERQTLNAVGILGGGQLGRMLALAGYPLGLRFQVLEPAVAAPAGVLAPQIVAGYDDAAALARLVAAVEVVTYEFENVPVAAARALARRVPVYPPPAALEAAQDRLAEKEFFRSLGIATAPFASVETRADLEAAAAAIGLPAVLKTRRLGYDGKGQALLRSPADLEKGWSLLGGAPLILEGFVPFVRELSILAARGRDGATVCYPLVENHHRDGILRLSRAPAPGLTPVLQAAAEAIATRAMAALDYIGVLAIELFALEEPGPRSQGQGGGEYGLASGLVVNEMAPRVHNSGHWTIEGAETSQFENHLRAVVGLPLGSTAARGHAAMLNIIGEAPDPAAVLAVPGAHLHLYGKAPRPGRKLGHITLRADDPAAVEAGIAALCTLPGVG